MCLRMYCDEKLDQLTLVLFYPSQPIPRYTITCTWIPAQLCFIASCSTICGRLVSLSSILPRLSVQTGQDLYFMQVALSLRGDMHTQRNIIVMPFINLHPT